MELVNKKKFYEFRFISPISRWQLTIESWDFPTQSIWVLWFLFFGKNFFLLLLGNLLLYLGRWDVEVAIEGNEFKRQKEEERKKVNLTKEP